METIEGILMQKLVTQAYFVMHTATILGFSFSENRCCFSFVLGKIAVKYLLISAFSQFLCPDVIFATYTVKIMAFLKYNVLFNISNLSSKNPSYGSFNSYKLKAFFG